MGLKVKKSPDNFVIVSNSKTSTTHCKQKTFRRLAWFKCWEQWSVYFEKLLNRSHLKWPARCREVFSSFNLKLGIVLTTYRCNYNVAATRDSDLKSSQFYSQVRYYLSSEILLRRRTKPGEYLFIKDFLNPRHRRIRYIT